jgi:hypothetical protein
VAPSGHTATSPGDDLTTVTPEQYERQLLRSDWRTMRRDDVPDDELLAALDQFTNTLYWLRARTSYTAAQAFAEALDDWTADLGGGLPEDHRGEDDLGASLVAFAEATKSVSTTAMLAEALTGWTSAVSAEHHRSVPFQTPAPPTA